MIDGRTTRRRVGLDRVADTKQVEQKARLMTVARMTNAGRITLPQAVRDALGLIPGDKVEFVPLSDGFKLVL